MPLPTIHSDETQADFISRFVQDPTAIKEFPDQKQRLAVAYSQWEKYKENKNLSKEERTNIHYWIVQEMQKRGLIHQETSSLDEETGDLLKVLSETLAPGLHQDVIDPDLKRLRDELLSLTMDRILGLSDEQLQEYHRQAGLILQERDLQRVQNLLESEISRRKTEGTKKQEKVLRIFSLQKSLDLDHLPMVFKELDRIQQMPASKQTKQLKGLWSTQFSSQGKTFRLGLVVSDSVNKEDEIQIDTNPPIHTHFDRGRLIAYVEEEVGDPVGKSYASFEIAKIMGEERMVIGPVLIPEVLDGQEDVISAQEIRQAMWNYMDQHGVVGFMHTVQKTVEGINGQVERAIAMGYTVEQLYKGVHNDSLVPGIAEILAHPRTFTGKFHIRTIYQAPVDFTLNNRPVRKDTWVLGVHVVDDLLWEAIKAGRITGFSIGGESERIKL